MKTITPYDLEQSILRPHLDPLVGELVIRLIQRSKVKVKEGAKGNGDEGSDLPVVTQTYEQWNENLAKKFSAMYKTYLKFKQKHLKEEGKQIESDQKVMKVDEFDIKVSNSIREHLLQYKDANLLQKLEHEQSSTFKTETLQLVKFFEFELEGIDPFEIEGQEYIRDKQREDQRAKLKENIYNNYVDTNKIEDFEDYHLPEKQELQIQYHKFHDLPIKTRVDILFFLC